MSGSNLLNRYHGIPTAKRGKKSSPYRGVYLHKSSKKYIAQIKVQGKETYLGLFKSEIEAAIAYDDKAYELYNNKMFKHAFNFGNPDDEGTKAKRELALNSVPKVEIAQPSKEKPLDEVHSLDDDLFAGLNDNDDWGLDNFNSLSKRNTPLVFSPFQSQDFGVDLSVTPPLLQSDSPGVSVCSVKPKI